MPALALWSTLAGAESAAGFSTIEAGTDASARYVVELEVATPAEVREVVERVESLVSADDFPGGEPVVLVLHGDEAAVFTRDNYAMYRAIVDSAARLDAFGAIDVRICAQWMSVNGVSRADIPRFVDPVPYGPAEVNRLLSQGYNRF